MLNLQRKKKAVAYNSLREEEVNAAVRKSRITADCK